MRLMHVQVLCARDLNPFMAPVPRSSFLLDSMTRVGRASGFRPGSCDMSGKHPCSRDDWLCAAAAVAREVSCSLELAAKVEPGTSSVRATAFKLFAAAEEAAAAIPRRELDRLVAGTSGGAHAGKDILAALAYGTTLNGAMALQELPASESDNNQNELKVSAGLCR